MFDENFEVFLADTKESKKFHYSIRYQVYCEEMGFENKEDFPLEQEFDEYDEDAVHFIVRHKKTKEWVGAMRLITQDNYLLPIEELCDLDETIDQSGQTRSVELSRLCVLKELRRGFKDIDPPNGISEEELEDTGNSKVQSLRNNHIISRKVIWGLIRAAVEYSYNNDIHNWLFLTTGALAKVLRKGGLEMLDIGDSCNHKGERFPFKMSVSQTYHSQIWENDYKNGYQMFSKIKAPRNYSIAA